MCVISTCLFAVFFAFGIGVNVESYCFLRLFCTCDSTKHMYQLVMNPNGIQMAKFSRGCWLIRMGKQQYQKTYIKHMKAKLFWISSGFLCFKRDHGLTMPRIVRWLCLLHSNSPQKKKHVKGCKWSSNHYSCPLDRKKLQRNLKQPGVCKKGRVLWKRSKLEKKNKKTPTLTG